MQDAKSPIAELVENLALYLRTKGEHVAYILADEIAQLIGKLAVFCLGVLLVIPILFFFSMALSHGIGIWLNIGPGGGFAVVGGLFLLIALVAHLSKKHIGSYVLNKLSGGLITKLNELFDEARENETAKNNSNSIH